MSSASVFSCLSCDGVEVNEEFSHTGDKGFFKGFLFVESQAEVEGTKRRVGFSHGANTRHVERVAHIPVPNVCFFGL